MRNIFTLLISIFLILTFFVVFDQQKGNYPFSPNLIHFQSDGKVSFTPVQPEKFWINSLVFYQFQEINKGKEVVLSDTGFEPSLLVIHEGDVVTFKTLRNKKFWPASDPHPTHGIYPEFDSHKGIGPGETWTFKFDKQGVWGYHDHLASSYSPDVGVIEVVSKDIKIDNEADLSLFEDCKTSRYGIRCWANVLRDKMVKGGLGSAFDLLKELYNKEPNFSENCNDITHYFGGLSYRFFKNRKTEVVIPQSLYCGGGFYHGFLEVWFHDDQDVRGLGNFCNFVGKTLIGDEVFAKQACYHGIGHGAYHANLITNWDDFKNEIKPAFSLCEKFESLDNCINGVFVAAVTDYYQSRYTFLKKKENPLKYCRELTSYKEACYGGFISILMSESNGDLNKMLAMATSIKEGVYKKTAIQTIMHVYPIKNRSQEDMNRVAIACRNLDGIDLTNTCYLWYIHGLVDFGQPGEEHFANFEFCKTPSLTILEKNKCHTMFIDYAKDYLSDIQFKNYCSQLSSTDNRYCLEKVSPNLK